MTAAFAVSHLVCRIGCLDCLLLFPEEKSPKACRQDSRQNTTVRIPLFPFFLFKKLSFLPCPLLLFISHYVYHCIRGGFSSVPLFFPDDGHVVAHAVIAVDREQVLNSEPFMVNTSPSSAFSWSWGV